MIDDKICCFDLFTDLAVDIEPQNPKPQKLKPYKKSNSLKFKFLRKS
jgi:hypothetical protein